MMIILHFCPRSTRTKKAYVGNPYFIFDSFCQTCVAAVKPAFYGQSFSDGKKKESMKLLTGWSMLTFSDLILQTAHICSWCNLDCNQSVPRAF